jgi:Peptidase family C25
MSSRALSAPLVICALVAWCPRAGAESATRFKLGVEEDGIYAVRFEDLVEAGLEAPDLDPSSLALANLGHAVPFLAEVGDDGRFGPGDRILFLGHRLAGERSYYHPYSPFDPYYLDTQAAAPSTAPRKPDAAIPLTSSIRTGRHFEPQRLMVRFGTPALSRIEDEDLAARADSWYWTSLSMVTDPVNLNLELPGLDAEGLPGSPLSVRVRLRGWSGQSSDASAVRLPDHRVEILAGGSVVAEAEWNGQESVEVLLQSLPAPALTTQGAHLELRVPPRSNRGASDPIVDAVLLDWVEVDYPRRPDLDGEQTWLVGPAANAVALTTRTPRLAVFDEVGVPWVAPSHALGNGRWEHSIALLDGPVWVAPDGSELEPSFLIADAPSELSTYGVQTDYIIVAHRSLLREVEPLAELHRERGLSVAVVDVEDVYDEFLDGIADPLAIKRFLQRAVEAWPKPAPRFVLLVGDASWDTRSSDEEPGVNMPDTFRPSFSRRARANPNRPQYETTLAPRGRNLVPAWRFAGPSGYAASDNWLAALEPGSRLPTLALGRLPVVTPEEVRAYVDKARDYAGAPHVGPWRRRLLLVTNQVAGFQRESDAIASRLVGSGLTPVRHYPAADVEVADYDRSAIRRAFDDGNLLVHFWGHGGRFVWRTGPPDLTNNRDLFTLADLDALAPTSSLPIVLSMTCYSAPFDHPTADSIGEKLIRLPHRGAIAVVAASWRTAPSWRLSQDLLDAFVRYETVGEAFLAGKRKAKGAANLAMFNLLGDPALPIARPPADIVIEPASLEEGDVVIEIPAPLRQGSITVDWMSDDLEVLASETLAARSPSLRVHPPAGLAQPARAVHAYAWDESGQKDALGALLLPQPSAAP